MFLQNLLEFYISFVKDLIFITAFCTSEEQEKALERCVESVSGLGYHIALISHSHVPFHIQKKCNYYFYDHLNETSDDVNLMAFKSYHFGEKTIVSKFFSKYFYGFSIYRMFSMASQIAINFGYENIHHIEYDCELLDKNLIKKHSDILETYDSVIYTDNGKDDGFLFGSFKSFKVKSLPDQFKNYNKEFIREQLPKQERLLLEFFTRNLFIKSGKVYFDYEPTKSQFKRGEDFYSKNFHFTLFYSKEDDSVNLFYKSTKDEDEIITVITNKKFVIEFNCERRHWYIKNLGRFDEIEHVRIDNSDKILYNKTFDTEFKTIFREKSFIRNEKNY